MNFDAIRGRFVLTSWLLLVIYPLFISFDLVPVFIGDRTYSVEFFLAALCGIVVFLQVAAALRIKVRWCNKCFLLGLAIWLGTNAVSLLIYPSSQGSLLVIGFMAKAAFGFLFYLTLLNNGGLKIMLNCYIAGCGVAGLFTIAHAVQAGSLDAVREASFVSLDSSTIDVDLLIGLAGAGAAKLLPLWFCTFMYIREAGKLRKYIYLLLLPYFAVLALMGLSRGVMVELCVALPILWFAVSTRFRMIVGLLAVVSICSIAAFIGRSQRWQERLLFETYDQFEQGIDPRSVMLMNTPNEFIDAPLLGHGPGSYPWRMAKYFSFFDHPGTAKEGAAAHNSFSAAAVETGIFGLLGLTLMVAGLGWRACSLGSWRIRLDNQPRLLALMIFLHICGWMFFSHGISSNPTWFFIGILLYLDRWMALGSESLHYPQMR